MDIDNYKMESGFVFQPSFYSAIKKLRKQSDREELYNAIMQYMIEGSVKIFTDEIKSAIWDLILPYLRKSKTKSKAKAESKQNKTESEQNQKISKSNFDTTKGEIKTEQNEIKTESKSNQNGTLTIKGNGNGNGNGNGMKREKESLKDSFSSLPQEKNTKKESAPSARIVGYPAGAAQEIPYPRICPQCGKLTNGDGCKKCRLIFRLENGKLVTEPMSDGNLMIKEEECQN